MRRVLVAIAALLATATSAAARWGLPEPLSDRGDIIADIYAKVFIAAVIVFIVVMVLLFYVLVRYREGGKGRASHEKSRHNSTAEAIWIIIPLIVVLWVGWISYVGLVQMEDNSQWDEANMMDLGITAAQWNWRADYGDGVSISSSPGSTTGAVAEANEFVVPAGRDILINVTSTDVIHALHIMDANGMTVGLVDANPGGDHKYNLMAVKFREGLYPVQCREMCLNPGHAYMRATFRAVPQAEFNYWKAGQETCQGAALIQDFSLAATPTDLTGRPDSNVTVVSGTCIRVAIDNPTDGAIEVTGNGIEGSHVIPANTVQKPVNYVAMQLPAEVGSYMLFVDGHGEAITFNTVNAEVRQLELGAFVINPDELSLEAGVTYLLQVKNVHTAPHNLFLGDRDAGNVFAYSATLDSGQTGSFVITLTQDEVGDFMIWCDVAGHFDAGMHGDLHVSA